MMSKKQEGLYLRINQLEQQVKMLKLVLNLADEKIDAMLDKFGYEYAGGMPINTLKREIKRAMNE